MVKLDFHRLSINDRDRYTYYLRQCPESASDYSFVNLLAWDLERQYHLSFAHDLCWLRLDLPSTRYWSPIGDWFKTDWYNILSETFPEGAVFDRVPEKLALKLKKELGERISLEDQRSEWEYIYSVRDLIELKGNRYHKKKNLLNQFRNNYDWYYREVFLSDIPIILEMQREWCSWKNCDGSDGLKAENDAISLILKSWNELPGLKAGTLFVKEQMVAYTIGETTDDGTVIIHFEKGLGDYKGVYQAIHQQFLERSASLFQWVNREQDMGKDGLRKAKMSYGPHHFLKKFILSWKP